MKADRVAAQIVISRGQQAALASLAQLKAQAAKIHKDLETEIGRVRTLRNQGFQRANALAAEANKLVAAQDAKLNKQYQSLLSQSEKDKANHWIRMNELLKEDLNFFQKLVKDTAEFVSKWTRIIVNDIILNPEYWKEVREMFKGYGDTLGEIGTFAWNVIFHPTVIAKNLWHAVTHLDKTWNALKTQFLENLKTTRGRGRLVMDGLLMLTGGGAGAKITQRILKLVKGSRAASRIAKTAKIVIPRLKLEGRLNKLMQHAHDWGFGTKGNITADAVDNMKIIAKNIYNKATQVRQGRWHEVPDAVFYFKNGHIVITQPDGTLITILKNATHNNKFNEASVLWNSISN